MGGFGSAPLGGNTASTFGAVPSWGTTPISSFGNNASTGFGAPTGFNQPMAMTASGKRIVPEEPQPEL
jgi:hypothetical protein